MNVTNRCIRRFIAAKYGRATQLRLELGWSLGNNISNRSMSGYPYIDLSNNLWLAFHVINKLSCLTLTSRFLVPLGLKKDFSYIKILKELKMELCCNGTVVQFEYG
ncbi:hypothetical protein L2E82_05568 [Cichorium intybus]|uniref:Uncharacterized protein n=1 Tax=Cichorium intybus TaxID=13427 RepID=A0ACB9H7J5_CICIN|nr:hypothetical protein L2E82_05568 [Cichorium intybus]